MTNERNDWILAFWTLGDHRQWTPTRVHMDPLLTDQEMGDRIAAKADLFPNTIYFWVREQDYYNIHRGMYSPS